MWDKSNHICSIGALWWKVEVARQPSAGVVRQHRAAPRTEIHNALVMSVRGHSPGAALRGGGSSHAGSHDLRQARTKYIAVTSLVIATGGHMRDGAATQDDSSMNMPAQRRKPADRTERQVLAAKGDSETSSESRVFHAMRENDEPGIVIVGSGLLQRSSDEVAQRCRRIDIELGVVPRDGLSLYPQIVDEYVFHRSPSPWLCLSIGRRCYGFSLSSRSRAFLRWVTASDKSNATFRKSPTTSTIN